VSGHLLLSFLSVLLYYCNVRYHLLTLFPLFLYISLLGF
jgi:hypothetical protein